MLELPTPADGRVQADSSKREDLPSLSFEQIAEATKLHSGFPSVETPHNFLLASGIKNRMAFTLKPGRD